MAQLASITVGDHFLVSDPDCLMINGHLVRVEAILPRKWILISFAPRSLLVLKSWGLPVEENVWYPVRPMQLRQLTASQRARHGLPEKSKIPAV